MQPDYFVVFATPTFDGRCSHEFTGCMERTMYQLGAEKIRSGHIFHPHLQFIDAARNAMNRQFLESYPDATHLFFIDEDVGGFQPHDVYRFITSGADIIAGIPPLKSDNPMPLYPVLLEADTDGTAIMNNGLLVASQVPTGFICIKRHVMEKLSAHPTETYSIQKPDGSAHSVFNVFDCLPRRGEFAGEDTTFCEKAIAAGFQILVDPSITFKHRGQRVWEGCFGDALKAYSEGNNPMATLCRKRDAA